MGFEEFGVVTFESTHHAINGEKIFKENNISFKTVPTPREITLSCGLSIRFKLEDLDRVKDLHSINTLAIKGIYSFTIENSARKMIKII